MATSLEDAILAMKPESCNTISISHTAAFGRKWFNVTLHWDGDGSYNPCVIAHDNTIAEALAKAEARRIATIKEARSAQEIAALEVASWGAKA